MSAKMVTKPCRYLLIDSKRLLNLAAECHKRWETDRQNQDRWDETTFSRTCLMSAVFFLEALNENVVRDFAVRKPKELPTKLRRKTGLARVEYERLPLAIKLYLMPYLCSARPDASSHTFFERGEPQFQRLAELIEIRDSIAHSKPFDRQLKARIIGGETFEIDDTSKLNVWPITGIPRDIFKIEHKHAVIAVDLTSWVIDTVKDCVGDRLKWDKWIESEVIVFTP